MANGRSYNSFIPSGEGRLAVMSFAPDALVHFKSLVDSPRQFAEIGK